MPTPEQKLISNLFLLELKFVKQICKKDSGTRIFLMAKSDPCSLSCKGFKTAKRSFTKVTGLTEKQNSLKEMLTVLKTFRIID